MIIEPKKSNPHRLNKGFSPPFHKDYTDRQTPGNDPKAEPLKRCYNNKKDQDISSKINKENRN